MSTEASPVATRPARDSYFTLAGAAGAYPALDGLRAIAILLVLARHGATALPAAIWEGASVPLQWLRNMAFNGWLGVDLFFVLSGCLIGIHLLRWREFSSTPYRYGVYMLKRVCRTFPLYYVVIGLILLGLLPAHVPRADISMHDVLTLLVFLQDLLGTPLLITLWSLAVEEKFYLVAPLLIFGLAKMGSLARALGALALAAAAVAVLRTGLVWLMAPEEYADFFWTFRAPLSLEPILIGVGCAFVLHSGAAKALVRKYLRALLLAPAAALLLLLCAAPFAEGGNWVLTSLAIPAAALCFACLVVATSVSARAASGFLGAWPMRTISRLSYALYLIHYPLVPAALLLAGQVAGAQAGALFEAAFLTLYLGASLLFAAILHFAVEKPFLLLKARL